VNVIESIRMAFSTLRSHKLRSALTMLGIIIGVGSVVALLAFGNGYGAFIDNEFRKLGNGAFYIFPGSVTRRVTEQQTAQLTAEDARALRESGASAILTSAAVIDGSSLVSNGRERGNYAVTGAEPAYMQITTNELGAGRYYTQAEEDSRARVAVIGQKIAERMFGSVGAAVGQRITIDGVTFEVIGVNVTKPGFMGDPQKNVQVPYSVARNLLYRNRFDRYVDVGQVVVQARSRADVQAAVREATEILRARHRLSYQPNDFTVLNLEELMQQINGIVVGFNAFLGVVASISLLVGGIGIMNIMLVSVAERTREIGLRRAVGARRSAILVQFLIEAVVLCLTGGLLGVLLGMALSPLASLMLQAMAQGDTSARAVVTPGAVLLACGMATTVGVVFGFFPALHASRLNPIEALRTE
jgi:putative ABC transport system permease protein